ncbi:MULTISPECIES: APH(3')-II family aminoglycoside O-phosphotransferase [unclassified Rhizobium]|uniref:APH(3')-II family aminoglycoside O-phosphotransferase n=1 Tax=unclassified Rhizobium TaxID=2613769 RepID=UPI0007C80951|nr:MULTISPECIES: APH(3') family aminoglycoside O-phosphotransferase [unclassified Rhizobium]MBN8951395.1 aminoglycoside 3'-phosphotransferase [Rhizobium tropici]OJY75499.1 MAG: APH(3') family aminoglycoside O-phosphotransferase [Rhizobium sp. 60-20]RKD66698.1 aminoglycoside 3'-phosphotransferase-2 [Rhizobium sp. WW_1]
MASKPQFLETSIPAPLGDLLAGYEWRQDALGRSSAHVFRLEADGRAPVYLKTELVDPLGELAGEVARLRWLAAQGLACPEVIAHERDNEREWLLMSALPGRDFVKEELLSPVDRVRLLADALRRLHAIDIATCPFDHRLENRIAEAGARLLAGRVDEDDFDETRVGRSGQDLFRELERTKPSTEDFVVTHGDACLPNFIANGAKFGGYIDCGRLGIADRHQDLALACGSIEYNFGADLVAAFLEAYGNFEQQAEKMVYYRLLDEFF